MAEERAEIEIDGKKLAVVPGSSVLQAALDAGVPVPHFCYHKKLSVTASCRMCLVEVEGAARLQPACALQAVSGMAVHTATAKVKEAQQAVLAFLLANHPLDCPVCDQAGECLLQDVSFRYGGGVSRYQEEKRVVLKKEAGPLVSMQEMARCIHCTRCLRFGEEVAGIRELGMFYRSERVEIAPAVEKAMASELSGNMIDLCPVGALTSRPFRFRARSWELASRFSVSPHDSLGSNLTVQTWQDRVVRVLPCENEAVNECWISDRDRFSYEGLNSGERLHAPMVKQGGQWIETDWAAALDYIVRGLRDIRADDGENALAALASPQATLEEMWLLKKLMNGLGSPNVDFRSRCTDFSLDGKVVPWLGMPVADIDALDSAFVIGAFLRQEQPVMAIRFRRAAKRGAIISSLHGTDDDWLMPVAHRMVAAPSQWPAQLAEVLVAVAQAKALAVPDGMDGITPSDTARGIAATLLAQGNHAIFLGNAAAGHPGLSQLHAMAEWLAEKTGARLGYLTEGANGVGGALVNALPPGVSGAGNLLACRHAAWLLLHVEPEQDAADPPLAMKQLAEAKMVVVMSPYRHGADYADVMLPVSPFTETAGTYISCEGRMQHFQGAVRPQGQTRPAWKVLRALGSLLELDGFAHESVKAVCDDFLHAAGGDIAGRLNNSAAMPPVLMPVAPVALERLTDGFSDPIVRRAAALQERQANEAGRIYLPVSLCEKLGVADGGKVRVRQGQEEAVLLAVPDEALPDHVACLSGSNPAAAILGSLFGALEVEAI